MRVSKISRMEKMPVLGYTSFLNALTVLIPNTDGLAELTPKNMRLQRGDPSSVSNAAKRTS